MTIATQQHRLQKLETSLTNLVAARKRYDGSPGSDRTLEVAIASALVGPDKGMICRHADWVIMWLKHEIRGLQINVAAMVVDDEE